MVRATIPGEGRPQGGDQEELSRHPKSHTAGGQGCGHGQDAPLVTGQGMQVRTGEPAGGGVPVPPHPALPPGDAENPQDGSVVGRSLRQVLLGLSSSNPS